MYILGYLVYAFCVFSYYKFNAIKVLLDQGIELAPVIVYPMIFLALYPLVLFSFHVLRRNRSLSAKHFLELQSKISSTVAVSLGLIGTFQGLTQMVATIAASMGGGGDMSERMAAMLSSIAEALSAMSYAFLTSIVGVGVSVIISIAVNFFVFFYNKKQTSQNKMTTKEIIVGGEGDLNDKVCFILKELLTLVDSSLIRKKEESETIVQVIKEQQEINKKLNDIVILYSSILESRFEEVRGEVMDRLDIIRLDSKCIKKQTEDIPKIFSLSTQIKLSLEKIMSIFNFQDRK